MTRSYRVSQFVRPRDRSLIALIAACLIALLGSAPVARAQDPGSFIPFEQDPATVDWSDQIPAHLAIVDGVAQLERDGRLEEAEENVPLLAGDRIVTSRGRVEVLFADGSVLDLDEFSSVDLLSDSLLRITNGRLRLSIVRTAGPLNYRVDAAGTTTWIRASGDYRVSMSDARAVEPEVRVTVLRGSAELTSPFGRTLIRTGAEARTTARSEPSLPYAMSAASWDAFDRWADDQHDDRIGTTSAQYLPAELRAYGGTFDQDGSWQYEQPYGYVWYPRVDVGWQPYYDGGWSFVGSFGWTWVGGGGRWGWPTHHYGRWGVSSDRWYWIPDRRWAPAWVSWGFRTRLRELVPTGLRQSAGSHDSRQRLQLALALGLGGGALSIVFDWRRGPSPCRERAGTLDLVEQSIRRPVLWTGPTSDGACRRAAASRTEPGRSRPRVHLHDTPFARLGRRHAADPQCVGRRQ